LAEAFASLGLIRSLYDWEWDEAERDYREAMRLNPGYATAHFWFAGDYLAMRGRFDEALAEIEIARQLDPLSALLIEGVGYIHMLAGRYAQAILFYREALDLDPHFHKALSSIGRALTQQGAYTDAIGVFQKARVIGGDVPYMLGAMGQTYALAGKKAEARRMIEQLAALSRERYVSSTCFALVHLGLGEKERALDWLDRACERREPSVAGIGVHPAYNELRGEPRFRALLERIAVISHRAGSKP
jgi:serine/threonine-protein kinase